MNRYQPCKKCGSNETLPPKCLLKSKIANVATICRHCGLRLRNKTERMKHELSHDYRCECRFRYKNFEEYHVHNAKCGYHSKFFCENHGCFEEFDCIREMYHHQSLCLAAYRMKQELNCDFFRSNLRKSPRLLGLRNIKLLSLIHI